MGLVNLLRAEGWQVAGLNLPLELTLQPDFSLRRWLAGRSPTKMVLIDLHWYEHCFGAIDVARLVKSVWPDAVTVIGGLTTSNFAEEILRSHAAVDYAIRGDAEEPLRQLARYVLGSGSDSEGSGDVDLATIPNLVRRERRERGAEPARLFRRAGGPGTARLREHRLAVARAGIRGDPILGRRADPIAEPGGARALANDRAGLRL